MTVKQLNGNIVRAEILLNCVPQCLSMALSGDVSSTADGSTWSSLGELREYKQVEEEEKKRKARNRKGGAGRSWLEINLHSPVHARRGGAV